MDDETLCEALDMSNKLVAELCAALREALDAHGQLLDELAKRLTDA